MISNLAYIHPDAKIGENVTVEPFAYIAGDVVIGDGCWIGPHAAIHDGARIGKNCKIHSFASIACTPQDLKFQGEVSTAVIGDNCEIRECVTISRGTASTGTTIIGSNNLVMAYAHVGHDCVVGNNCVIVNGVSLAGEVHVGDWVVIGGHSAVHQWTHIGDHDDPRHDRCNEGCSSIRYALKRRSLCRYQQSGSFAPRLQPRADYGNPRCVPNPLPERIELHKRLRQGRGGASSISRARLLD